MEQQRYSACRDREWRVSSVLASCAGGKWSWRTLCLDLNELLSLFSIPSFLYISFSKWCPVGHTSGGWGWSLRFCTWAFHASHLLSSVLSCLISKTCLSLLTVSSMAGSWTPDWGNKKMKRLQTYTHRDRQTGVRWAGEAPTTQPGASAHLLCSAQEEGLASFGRTSL